MGRGAGGRKPGGAMHDGNIGAEGARAILPGGSAGPRLGLAGPVPRNQGGTSMKRLTITLAALSALTVLPACEVARGTGQVVQGAGNIAVGTGRAVVGTGRLVGRGITAFTPADE